MKEKLLQWHSAFYAGIQIELEEEADYLIFENEHMLSTKPMQVDVVIIKNNSERVIRKNIGRIFKKYNIVEYKSPDDYLSVDDFYKVHGYACFYKSDSKKVNEIKVDEVTITFVCSHYPRELMKHLVKNNRCIIDKKELGIYYILGDMFPIQILVTSELSEENNLWLRNLTNNLKDAITAERLVREYEKKQHNRLYSSVMDVVVRANVEKFEEVRRMCDALRELMKDDIQKEVNERVQKEVNERVQKEVNERVQKELAVRVQESFNQEKENLIRKKILKNKTIEQIADELETNVEEILPIYNRIKEKLM